MYKEPTENQRLAGKIWLVILIISVAWVLFEAHRATGPYGPIDPGPEIEFIR